jgi:hypothetical protein
LGTGGDTGRAPTDGVLCMVPTLPLITDFTYVPGEGDTSQAGFGDCTTLMGGEWLAPNSGSYPLASDVTQGNWHITGTVGDYSQFALFFTRCDGMCDVVDASKYKGISFTISGSIGQNHQLTLVVSTLNDAIAASWINTHGGTSSSPGRCIPTAGTDQWNEQGCSNPSKRISVTATPTLVSVPWADFAGGSPDAYVATPAEIIAITWQLPWDPWTNPENPYAVDIVIDDLSFIP